MERTYVLSQETNIHMLPTTVTKSREVRFSIQFLQMLHRIFTKCKHHNDCHEPHSVEVGDHEKMWNTKWITLTYRALKSVLISSAWGTLLTALPNGHVSLSSTRLWWIRGELGNVFLVEISTSPSLHASDFLTFWREKTNNTRYNIYSLVYMHSNKC